MRSRLELLLHKYIWTTAATFGSQGWSLYTSLTVKPSAWEVAWDKIKFSVDGSWEGCNHDDVTGFREWAGKFWTTSGFVDGESKQWSGTLIFLTPVFSFTSGQFHQNLLFMSSFCANFIAPKKLNLNFSTKKLLKKCWWNLHLFNLLVKALFSYVINWAT